MRPIQSFPPIETRAAKALILGTMPGRESLRAGQYYAHPRNAFWRIMDDLINAGPALAYETRIEVMKANGLALWDVLASCRRRSSMDADIEHHSARPNDLASFFLEHPNITHVFFNGSMAETFFQRYARPWLDSDSLHFTRLPSTSPANASMRYEQKLDAWKAIVRKSKTLQPWAAQATNFRSERLTGKENIKKMPASR
jgi:TDG/mug DNA glycosylase family protein